MHSSIVLIHGCLRWFEGSQGNEALLQANHPRESPDGPDHGFDSFQACWVTLGRLVVAHLEFRPAAFHNLLQKLDDGFRSLGFSILFKLAWPQLLQC